MEQPIKTVIVDDDPNFLFYLKTLLNKNNKVEIFKTFNTGREFLNFLDLGNNICDVAFLDIALPDINGNKIGKKIRKKSPNMQIVFVTGNIEYAAEAFDLEASDYLVKPFDLERLKRCLDRVALRILYSKLENKPYIIRNKNKTEYIKIEIIIYIEKVKKRVVFHTKDKIYECNYNLKNVERSIKNKGFIRSHKSYIININYVKSIEKWGDRAYQISFYGTDKKALLSRHCSEKVKKLLQKIKDHKN